TAPPHTTARVANRTASTLSSSTNLGPFVPIRNPDRVTSRTPRQHFTIEAQQLRHRPRLQGTATGPVRVFGLGKLGHGPQVAELDAGQGRGQKASPGFLAHRGFLTMHPQPGFDEGPRQPRPYSPLVISPVSLGLAAAVVGDVARLPRSQAAKPGRRP